MGTPTTDSEQQEWTPIRVWEHEHVPQAALRIAEAVRTTGPETDPGIRKAGLAIGRHGPGQP
jgi:hypothetical protein